MVNWQEDTPGPDWDKTQTERAAHFLQSSAWAAFLAARNKRVFFAQDAGWSWLATFEVKKLGKYLYCPYGPTVSSADDLSKALASIKSCAKKLKADFIRIEPQGPITEKDLRALHLQRAHRDIQPRFTLLKDLSRSDEDLLIEMSSTNRRLYRRASELGFTFKSSQNPEDIEPFLDMLQETAKRHNVVFHAREYFKTMASTLMPLGAAKIFYAIHDQQPAAACLTFENSNARYYAHAASADAARKLQPGVPLMGHVIFDAKAEHKQLFDYYGIAPPDQPDHKLAGVTQFKKSFGGEVKETLGTWELPVRIVRYHSYRLVRKIRH
ncbi:MAG TPA: peptidoglycan bridge formation glycyltransferase FemA/FemB family protein [Patescibacteria group bacterium]|nr:peptidoglycan bridge formation glycyltransferase FemA/FemB family protein [Patescibacteria group bacterium]